MSPAVVLLHGFTNTARSWDDVVAALPAGYRSLAPDIRGHGAASAIRPVTLRGVIEDIDAAAPERFTLAGYSMGGRIALHAALELPERVRRLVLVGASPGLKGAVARAERRAADERLADVAERLTITEFSDRWAKTPVLAGQPDDVRAAVDADRRRNRPDGLAAALRGLGTGALPSLWPRLRELEIPVELIVGELDAKFRATAAQMAQELPDAHVTVVAGAGHAVHLERPGAVAEIISRA
ncbi:MAG: 2-succinyl-6-hydroxy-2,4-cyclohexadiene-1-carboxylate synthase [Solirubrobacteraceae bacterium]